MSTFLQKNRQRMAHSNHVSLGPKDLKHLGDVIAMEKKVIETLRRGSQDASKSALLLKEWGLTEGPDMGDVLGKLSSLFDYLAQSENVYSNHYVNYRLYFKTIRTQEEHFAVIKRKEATLASKIESLDRKISKTKEENKELPILLHRMSELRDEMTGLQNTVASEEAKLSALKRQSTKEALTLKFGAMLELASKTQIVAEMGRLLLECLPTDRYEPGERPIYDRYEKTEALRQEALAGLQEVVFNPAVSSHFNEDFEYDDSGPAEYLDSNLVVQPAAPKYAGQVNSLVQGEKGGAPTPAYRAASGASVLNNTSSGGTSPLIGGGGLAQSADAPPASEFGLNRSATLSSVRRADYAATSFPSSTYTSRNYGSTGFGGTVKSGSGKIAAGAAGAAGAVGAGAKSLMWRMKKKPTTPTQGPESTYAVDARGGIYSQQSFPQNESALQSMQSEEGATEAIPGPDEGQAGPGDGHLNANTYRGAYEKESAYTGANDVPNDVHYAERYPTEGQPEAYGREGHQHMYSQEGAQDNYNRGNNYVPPVVAAQDNYGTDYSYADQAQYGDTQYTDNRQYTHPSQYAHPDNVRSSQDYDAAKYAATQRQAYEGEAYQLPEIRPLNLDSDSRLGVASVYEDTREYQSSATQPAESEADFRDDARISREHNPRISREYALREQSREYSARASREYVTSESAGGAIPGETEKLPKQDAALSAPVLHVNTEAPANDSGATLGGGEGVNGPQVGSGVVEDRSVLSSGLQQTPTAPGVSSTAPQVAPFNPSELPADQQQALQQFMQQQFQQFQQQLMAQVAVASPQLAQQSQFGQTAVQQGQAQVQSQFTQSASTDRSVGAGTAAAGVGAAVAGAAVLGAAHVAASPRHSSQEEAPVSYSSPRIPSGAYGGDASGATAGGDRRSSATHSVNDRRISAVNSVNDRRISGVNAAPGQNVSAAHTTTDRRVSGYPEDAAPEEYGYENEQDYTGQNVSENAYAVAENSGYSGNSESDAYPRNISQDAYPVVTDESYSQAPETAYLQDSGESYDQPTTDVIAPAVTHSLALPGTYTSVSTTTVADDPHAEESDLEYHEAQTQNEVRQLNLQDDQNFVTTPADSPPSSIESTPEVPEKSPTEDREEGKRVYSNSSFPTLSPSATHQTFSSSSNVAATRNRVSSSATQGSFVSVRRKSVSSVASSHKQKSRPSFVPRKLLNKNKGDSALGSKHGDIVVTPQQSTAQRVSTSSGGSVNMTNSGYSSSGQLSYSGAGTSTMAVPVSPYQPQGYVPSVHNTSKAPFHTNSYTSYGGDSNASNGSTVRAGAFKRNNNGTANPTIGYYSSPYMDSPNYDDRYVRNGGGNGKSQTGYNAVSPVNTGPTQAEQIKEMYRAQQESQANGTQIEQ